MKLPVFQHLLDINAGFDQVVRGLEALQKERHFHGSELKRFSALAKEARASTNSYLLGVLEQAEVKEAGRRFGRRWEREQQEETGPTRKRLTRRTD